MPSLRNFPLFILFLFFSINGFAQEINSEQALKLVEKNSAEIGVSTGDIENMQVTNAYTDNVPRSAVFTVTGLVMPITQDNAGILGISVDSWPMGMAVNN